MSLTLTRRHNVDRFGYLIPTKYGNVPMVGAVATYRPGEGRFGGAVAVEERTTNILWVGWEQGGVNPSDGSLYGASNRIRTPLIAVSPSTTYTFSVQDTAYAILAIYEYQTDGTYIQRTLYSDQVFSMTTTENTGQIRVIAVRQGDEALTPDAIEVFKPQGEARPYATSFVAGTRAAGRLTYPAKDIVNPEAGTIHMYLQAPVLDKDWFLWDTRVNRHHAFYRASTGQLEIFWNNSKRMLAALPQDKAWHTVTVVWQGEQTSLLIDGEDKATDTIPGGIQLADDELFTLGSRYNYADQATKLIDEFLVLPYAASEEEIASWYEAQGPLPPHPQALLQWDWQAVRPAQVVKL